MGGSGRVELGALVAVGGSELELLQELAGHARWRWTGFFRKDSSILRLGVGRLYDM